MPRDFKSFAKENENIINENKNTADNYEKLLNKYKNMDNNELMSNLLSEANKLKKEGKLDSNMLNTLKTSLLPFLNTEQQEMLKNLIEAIDD